jgi:hypothetical protein
LSARRRVSFSIVMRGLDPRIQASSREPVCCGYWLAGSSPGNDEKRNGRADANIVESPWEPLAVNGSGAAPIASIGVG